MEKQTMFMLKCLVEGKNIPGRRQGTVLCLLFPRKQETQNRPLPTPERHGQNGQKKETGTCLLNAQLVRESNP